MGTWVFVNDQLPAPGQHIEVIIKRPGTFQGKDPSGFTHWSLCDVFEEIIAWRIAPPIQEYEESIEIYKLGRYVPSGEKP